MGRLKGHTHSVALSSSDGRPVAGEISNMLHISWLSTSRLAMVGQLQLIGHSHRGISTRIGARIGLYLPILALITPKSPSGMYGA